MLEDKTIKISRKEWEENMNYFKNINSHKITDIDFSDFFSNQVVFTIEKNPFGRQNSIKYFSLSEMICLYEKTGLNAENFLQNYKEYWK